MKPKHRFLEGLKQITPFLLIIIVTVSLFGTCHWFYKTSVNYLIQEEYKSISEITGREALTFKTKLEDQLLMLESLTKNFLDIDFTDYNATKETILNTRDIGDFKKITFATSTGFTINNNNTTSGNILKKDYFQEALSGSPNISSAIEVDENGEEVLVLAVPIEKHEETPAVLTGTFNRAVLNQLFPADSFDGKGYSYVTDSAGNAIVLPEQARKEHIVFNDNFLSFLELTDLSNDILVEDVMGDFALGASNIIEYEIGQKQYIAFYTPIGIHDWYSLTILSSDYLQERIVPYSNSLFILITVITLLFLIPVLCLLYYKFRLLKVFQLKQELIQKEKYLDSITAHQHLILFDYDYDTGQVTLSGDVSYINAECEENLLLKPDEFLELLHPEDVAVIDSFRNCFINPVSTFSCEFRLKCTDSSYHWFHMQTDAIRNLESDFRHLYGNIVNVDATNKTPLIFADSQNELTGFLNLQSFEEKVNRILRSSDPKNIYGLYLIGPDGFTEINHIMGHETGDQILLQIAQRTAAVFSEADVFGHISGDTFAVFLHIHPDMQDSALTLIQEKAEKLSSRLTDTFQCSKGSYHLTTSIGISLFAKDGANCKTLLKQAYTALNYVKKYDRGHFNIYSIEMEDI